MDTKTGEIYQRKADEPLTSDTDIELTNRQARRLSKLSIPDRIEWSRRQSETQTERNARKRLRKLQRAARRNNR